MCCIDTQVHKIRNVKRAFDHKIIDYFFGRSGALNAISLKKLTFISC